MASDDPGDPADEGLDRPDGATDGGDPPAGGGDGGDDGPGDDRGDGDPPPPPHGHHQHHAHHELHAPPAPPLAARLRRLDDSLGQGERVLIAMFFTVLVMVGFYRTAVDYLFNKHPGWAIELTKASVFALAMMGAAFATHHKRNFSLDLISRFVGARGRAWLRVVINLLTALAAVLLFHGGRLVQHILDKEPPHHELVPVSLLGWFMPVAAVLILIHVVLHTAIEIDYLRHGRTAPEAEQAVH